MFFNPFSKRNRRFFTTLFFMYVPNVKLHAWNELKYFKARRWFDTFAYVCFVVY